MPSPAGIAVDPYVANWNAQHPNQPIEAYSTPTGAKGYRYLGSASGVNPSGATSPNAKPGSSTPINPGANTAPAPAGTGGGIADSPDTLHSIPPPPIVSQPDSNGDQSDSTGTGTNTGKEKAADPFSNNTSFGDGQRSSMNSALGTLASAGLTAVGAPMGLGGTVGAGITTGLDTIDANKELEKANQPDLSIGEIGNSFAANTSLGAAFNAMSSFVNDHFGLNLGQIENVAANQAQAVGFANTNAFAQDSFDADAQASKDLNAPGGPVDQANQGNVSSDNVSNAYGGAPSNDGRANVSPDDTGSNAYGGAPSNDGRENMSPDSTDNDGGNDGSGGGDHEGHESDGGTGGGSGGGAGEGGDSGNAATGGYIRGPGTGTSDSINAHLSNEEYVSDAHTVKTFGPEFFGALQVLAHKGNPPVNNTTQHFATGGMASIQGFNLPQASMAHPTHIAPPKVQIKTHGTVGGTPHFAGGGMMAPAMAPIVDPAQQRMQQATQVVQQGLAQFSNGGETHYADGGMVGAPMAPQGPASAPAPVPAQQPIMAPPGQAQPGPGPSPNPDQAQQPKGPPPFVFPPEIAQYIGYEKLEKMVQSTAEKLAKNAAAHQQAQQQNSAPQGGMASPPPQAQNGPLPGSLNPAPVNPMQNPTGVGASPAQMPNRQPAASLTGPVSKSFMGV